LFGRGAVDMKGGVACFVAAIARHIEKHGAPKGSVSFLITGDEEGPAINGTTKLLQWAAERGETVVGYGAPGKGNTLLNHCGIRPDLLAYTVDRNPYKHGRFTPGTRIPILPPEQIAADKPDYVLVLPWNLRAELVEQLSFVHDWGGRLVFPIPELSIVEVASRKVTA
jgi:hypothetical protein